MITGGIAYVDVRDVVGRERQHRGLRKALPIQPEIDRTRFEFSLRKHMHPATPVGRERVHVRHGVEYAEGVEAVGGAVLLDELRPQLIRPPLLVGVRRRVHRDHLPVHHGEGLPALAGADLIGRRGAGGCVAPAPLGSCCLCRPRVCLLSPGPVSACCPCRGSVYDGHLLHDESACEIAAGEAHFARPK